MLVQTSTLRHLLAERSCQPRHALLEGLIVLLGRRCPDIAAGRQNVALRRDLLRRRRLAESRLVGIAPVGLAPGMIGVGDFGDVNRSGFAGGSEP